MPLKSPVVKDREMCLFRRKGSFLKILSSEGRNHGTSYKDAKAVSTDCSFSILGLEKRAWVGEGQGAGEEEEGQ